MGSDPFIHGLYLNEHTEGHSIQAPCLAPVHLPRQMGYQLCLRSMRWPPYDATFVRWSPALQARNHQLVPLWAKRKEVNQR